MHISADAILAATATVVKEVTPYTIVVGDTVSLLKDRVSDEQVTALIKLRCWNRSTEKITAIMQKFTGNTIEALLTRNNIIG